MNTNANLTIYNECTNPETREQEYIRTVIKNVNWYEKQETSVGDKGLNCADVYKIRIPENSPDKVYIDAKEYRNLTDKTGYWTIQKRDNIVRGIVVEDIKKPSDLTKYSHVCTVNSFSENLRGSLPHWRIEGV